MKNRINKFLLTALLLAAPLAHADIVGLFVEPGLTRESGDTAGEGIAARIGFHFTSAFFAGIDARYSMPQIHDSSLNYSAKATATNFGPVVGVQMPGVGLRVWGSYVTSADANAEQSGNFDMTYGDGNGYRVGAGFHIAIISLNLEYQEIKYGSVHNEAFLAAPSGYPDLQTKSWILSLSFPLSL